MLRNTYLIRIPMGQIHSKRFPQSNSANRLPLRTLTDMVVFSSQAFQCLHGLTQKKKLCLIFQRLFGLEGVAGLLVVTILYFLVVCSLYRHGPGKHLSVVSYIHTCPLCSLLTCMGPSNGVQALLSCFKCCHPYPITQ